MIRAYVSSLIYGLAVGTLMYPFVIATKIASQMVVWP